MSVTATEHHASYPAISPSRPELSHSGRTVLVTGSSEGIGFAIAKAFAEANSATVIITGRRQETADAAVSQLKKEVPSFKGDAVALRADVGNADSIAVLFSQLEEKKLVVDTLVLGAAAYGKETPLLESDINELWDEYLINVRSPIDFAQRFHKQNVAHPNGNKKTLLNVSTAAINELVLSGSTPSYSSTKNSGTLLVQQVAKDVAVQDMQIISFHPGIVYTAFARARGFQKEGFPWDDAELPGHFSVWASSNEASFLHGRFVHTAWDVEEMKNGLFRQRLADDHDYLKIGVHGLPSSKFTLQEIMAGAASS